MFEAAVFDGISGVGHGFFTRQGGISTGLYSSLNCGVGSGDEPACVAANRGRAMARLGLEASRLVTGYQVHSAQVAVIDRPWPAGEIPRVDGLVTRRRGVALGILTADCASVLFADREGDVIGAAHAGWKGALDGIVEQVVEAMEGLGARRRRIVAAVGPCIQQDSYEVGPEFQAAFVAADDSNRTFFRPSARPGYHQFDLPGYVRRRLERLRLAAIDVLPLDTCSEDALFFSYRRATKRGEQDYGRGLSAIRLAG